MVRALDRSRAAALERGGGAGVRLQSPGAGGGGVDGVADQRVPEREPPRRRGGADQRRLKQRVQRRQRDLLAQVRDVGHQLGLKRLAGHRRGLQHAPRRAGQRVELSGQRGRDRGGNPGGARPERRRGTFAGSRAGELLEIERVAAAELVQPGGNVAAVKGGRLGRG